MRYIVQTLSLLFLILPLLQSNSYITSYPYLPVFLQSIRLSVCLESVYRSVYLSFIYLSLYLSIYQLLSTLSRYVLLRLSFFVFQTPSVPIVRSLRSQRLVFFFSSLNER